MKMAPRMLLKSWGDAAREPSDGLHLLRLDELPFEVLALRDVEHDTDDFARLPRSSRRILRSSSTQR